MSDLIINNKTLPVNEDVKPSGFSHAFDTGYAIAYGVDEAIMIKNFQFFITANANRGHNFYEGRFWTYDRLEDFLSHFPYWSVQSVRRILQSLINQKVLIKGDFNKSWSNRTVWYAFKDQEKFITNVRPPKTPSPLPPSDFLKQANEDFQKKNADLLKSTNDICGNQQMTNVDSSKCIYDASTIPDAVSNTTPSLKVSEKVAVAPESEAVFPKKSKASPEFSSKVREVAKEMIDLISKHNPVYRPPPDLTKFLYQVAQMIEVDKQDPAVLLKTFSWGVADNEQRGDFNGWQGIICTNNKGGKVTTPAEIFRRYFSKIHAQMTSRPKRKFAAGTDLDVAMEAMEEMNKRAI